MRAVSSLLRPPNLKKGGRSVGYVSRGRRSRVVYVPIWVLSISLVGGVLPRTFTTQWFYFFSRSLFCRERSRDTLRLLRRGSLRVAQVARGSGVRGNRITLGAGDDVLNIYLKAWILFSPAGVDGANTKNNKLLTYRSLCSKYFWTFNNTAILPCMALMNGLN